MKRTIAKLGFQSLVAMFFLLGGLMLSNSAAAQSISNGQQVGQNLNWHTAQEATTLFKDAVSFWHNQIGQYTPGTSNHTNAVRHAAYFKAIIAQIESGDNVQSAVKNALGAAASLGGEKEAATTSRSVLTAIYNEAVDIATY
jgi:hypothetical protein